MTRPFRGWKLRRKRAKTKTEVLQEFGAKRRFGRTYAEIDKLIMAEPVDLLRLNKFRHFWPEATFNAYWLQYGNTHRIAKKQLRLLWVK